MSINFVDESEYANDMDALDDLSAASPAGPGPKQDISEYIEELCGTKPETSGPDAFDLELSDDDEPLNFGSGAPPTKPFSRFDERAEAKAMSFFNDDSDDIPVSQSELSQQDKTSSVAQKTNTKAPLPHAATNVILGGSDEEQDQKRVLLVQIARYRETWPFLEEVVTFPTTLHKKSVEKLEEIRNECSGRVQNRNCMKGLRIVFNGAMAQFETFVTSRFTSVELQGFAKACEMDEVVQDSIKELEIKYLSSSGVMAPEARLIMGLLLVAYATHSKNRTTRLVQGVAHSRAPDLGHRYSDL